MTKLLLLSLLSLCLVSCQGGPPTAIIIPSETAHFFDTATSPVATELPIPDKTEISTITPGSSPETLSPTLPATPTAQGISVQEDALIPPIPPAELTAEWQDSSALLTWSGTGSDIDTHYNLYRRGSADQPWQEIAFVAVAADNRGTYSFLDQDIQRDKTYVYAVSTVDRYGKESSLTTFELPSSP